MDASRWAELWLRTAEHLTLTGISTAFAVATGIPLGVLAFREPRLRAAVLGAAGILQTIPSLAMLALLLVLLQRIGVLPALVALSLYALLPIIRNTLAGFESIPPPVREAALGIGMTSRQLLWIVELPLAAPVLFAGIRTAAVVSVGIATLSAFIGAGGLGQFINRGLALARYELILLGAVPAAALALLVDATLGAAAWALGPLRRSDRGSWRARLRPWALSSPLLLVVLGVAAARLGGSPASSGMEAQSLRIGGKNFTEQILLAEIYAQLVEARTDLGVERYSNLGGTMICHRALVAGALDLYVEYSGTALTAILGLEMPEDPGRVWERLRAEYGERFDLEWLAPLGFDNTYVLAVREVDARERGWRSISDLAGEDGLRAGFPAEFAERPDGYPGLARAYRLPFAEVHDLEPSLMYAALDRGQVDVIAAFATDGRLETYGLATLADDAAFFPPYQAAPVVRREVLRAHPALRDVLSSLAARIDEETMRRMNAELDEGGRSAASVAREFLRREGLAR